jgi:membrane associated rhomboid family serine protease
VLGAFFGCSPTRASSVSSSSSPITIPAYYFLGFWFLYQLFEANFGLLEAQAHGGGVAFFAHVGGFVFGYLVARLLVRSGHLDMREDVRSAYGVSA